MIDTPVEEFTAKEAVDAGLIDAILDGSAKVSGTYTLSDEGFIEFEQNNFVFNDKFGVLRVGRFKNAEALLDFWGEFGAVHGNKSKTFNILLWE